MTTDKTTAPRPWLLGIVALAFCAAHWEMVIFQVPRLKEKVMESDLGELTSATKLMFTLSMMSVHYWYILIPLTLGAVLAAYATRKRALLIALVVVMAGLFAFERFAMSDVQQRVEAARKAKP